MTCRATVSIPPPPPPTPSFLHPLYSVHTPFPSFLYPLVIKSNCLKASFSSFPLLSFLFFPFAKNVHTLWSGVWSFTTPSTSQGERNESTRNTWRRINRPLKLTELSNWTKEIPGNRFVPEGISRAMAWWDEAEGRENDRSFLVFLCITLKREQ